MDKKKIISSLTMAGLMATTVAGASVYAADVDPDTKALGEYSKLIENKVAVPFILQSDKDAVTVKDLKLSFPGKTITGVTDDTVLKTGDVVRINGEARTIVIYGDTNGDGKINIMDAVTTLNHVKGKATLEGAYFAAADLNNNKSLNIMEAVNVLNVVKGKASYASIATAPASETAKTLEKEVLTNGTTKVITIKVKYDADANGYTYALYDNEAEKEITINAVAYDKNDKEATLTLNALTGPETALKAAVGANKDQTYTLTVKDKNGNVVAKDTFKYMTLADIDTVTIDGDETIICANNVNTLSLKVKLASTTGNEVPATVKVTLKDKAGKEVTGTATLAKNQVAAYVNNFNGVSGLEDGIVAADQIEATVKIIDENGNEVEKVVKFVKDTEKYEVLNIVSSVTAGKLGDVVLTTKKDVTPKKAYILVKDANSSATASEVVADGEEFLTAKITTATVAGKTTHTISAANLTDVEVPSGNVASKIFVVVEKANGVKSELASATMTRPLATTPLEAVTAVEYYGNPVGTFKWADAKNKAADVKEYKVILYASADNGTSYVPVATKTSTTKSIDLNTEIKSYIEDNKTANKFKIAVYAEPTLNSDYKESAVADTTDGKEYATSALPTPTLNAIDLDADTHHQTISWTASAGADYYVVNLYKYESDATTANKGVYKEYNAGTNTSEDLTDIMKNLPEGKYDVKVMAKAYAKSQYVDSDESAETKTTYNVKAPTDLTVTLKNSNKKAKAEFSKVSGITDSDAANNKITYKVVYGILDGDELATETEVATTPVTDTDLYETDVFPAGATNLSNASTYGFYVKVMLDKAIAGTAADMEVARTPIKPIETPKAEVDLTEAALTVFKYAGTNGTTGISYKDNNVLIIKGEEYTSTKDLTQYNEVLAVVKLLNAGDTIQLDADNNITATINKSNSNLGNTAFKDVKVVIGTADIGIAGTVKEVKVDVANADLTYATVTKEVTLADATTKVDVAENTKVKLFNGDAVTINDVTVTPAVATDVTAIKGGIDVKGITGTIGITATDKATVNISGNQKGLVTLTAAVDNDDKKVVTMKSTNPVELKVEQGVADITDLNYSVADLKFADDKDNAVITRKAGTQIRIKNVDITVNPSTSAGMKIDVKNGTVKGAGTLVFDTSIKTGTGSHAYTENKSGEISATAKHIYAKDTTNASKEVDVQFSTLNGAVASYAVDKDAKEATVTTTGDTTLNIVATPIV